jgi:hypothetical protein
MIDHVEPKTKIQVEQVHGVFKGPQTSSGGDTNLDWIKASPGASNPILDFFLLYIFFMNLACALCCRS